MSINIHHDTINTTFSIWRHKFLVDNCGSCFGQGKWLLDSFHPLTYQNHGFYIWINYMLVGLSTVLIGCQLSQQTSPEDKTGWIWPHFVCGRGEVMLPSINLNFDYLAFLLYSSMPSTYNLPLVKSLLYNMAPLIS
jgi:hypothetical protein